MTRLAAMYAKVEAERNELRKALGEIERGLVEAAGASPRSDAIIAAARKRARQALRRGSVGGQEKDKR